MKHPTRLGKYAITGVLGEGAMGVVYKGFDPDIRRIVALKTVRTPPDDETESDGMAAQRFVNEARAAGRLSHPGIVAVYEFGEDQGVKFIAMEYVEGQSLSRYLRSGVRFTDNDIPGIMSQLLDAIDHAHQQGVWHRDIKPANVIMTRAGRLKVADFGIARIDGSALTQVATQIGTPSHMAPEQFLGRGIDHRVDIYAAGVVLYALLTGRVPFSGTPEALMYQVVNESVRPPSQLGGEPRPVFYDALVSIALAKDPGARFASAALFKQALVRAVSEPIDESAWEKTVISVPMKPAAVASPASSSSVSSTHWDRDTLSKAESSLARFVGPIAGILVRRAARDCTDPTALYSALAAQIDSAADRASFLRQSDPAANRHLTPPRVAPVLAESSGAAAGSSDTRPLSAEMITKATQLLAQHLGPIAGVMVKRAAVPGATRGGFFRAITAAIDDPTRRSQLLQALEKLS